ncbi:hypothetical protein PZB74_09545 [Porifericola rhodea]|uniref:hypothetical protein n=1 Tax=Porifericola rhodea TaxID=930972 RepID=UPI0026654BC8|nr:hypothetical protein [Porifericola rhodea]WKN33574.1 hypothetical protein PZB74_09545 [Porifericola rhodea]
MSKLNTLLFSILLIYLSSCASIVSKTRYPVSLNSTPNNATVTITDKKGREVYSGQTPANIYLKSGSGYFGKAQYLIKFTKEGYQAKTVPITATLNGWYFGNIVFGGLIGFLIVDPATGAMYRIDTMQINETLGQTVAQADENSLKIMSIDEVPEIWKSKLIEIKSE